MDHFEDRSCRNESGQAFITKSGMRDAGLDPVVHANGDAKFRRQPNENEKNQVSEEETRMKTNLLHQGCEQLSEQNQEDNGKVGEDQFLEVGNSSNFCSQKRFGQLPDDLPNPLKHRLIVQDQLGTKTNLLSQRCEQQNEQELEDNDKDYWRPSCMFHWLQSIGRQVSEAYEAFREYNGRASYEELSLEKPAPMIQEDDGSELSHMSDYDNMGFIPDECNEPIDNLYEEFGQCCGEPNGVERHAHRTHNDDDHVDNVRGIRSQAEEVHVNRSEGGFETARTNNRMVDKTTKKDNMQIPRTTLSSGNGKRNSEHNIHVETCREVVCRDVTTHETREDENTGTITLQRRRKGEGHVGKVWCSQAQSYKTKQWSNSETGENNVIPNGQHTDGGHVTSLTLGRREKKQRDDNHHSRMTRVIQILRKTSWFAI